MNLVNTNGFMSGLLSKIGEEIFESGRLWDELHNTEALAVLRYISTNSNNNQEICDRLEKTGCEMFFVVPFEQTGSNFPEIKEPTLSLIGITTRSGMSVSVVACAPKNSYVLKS